jgi:hypothetical protein
MSDVRHCMLLLLTREKEQIDGKTPERERAHNYQFLALHVNQTMKAEGQGGSWGGIVTVCVCTYMCNNRASLSVNARVSL